MRTRTTFVPAILVFALGAATGGAAAQTPEGSPTYAWHGELVSLDQPAGTVTLKSRLVGDALTQVKQFKPGDRVLLHWSGFDTSADAIRGVTSYDAARASHDRFLFPAELVTPDVQNDYATFRFRIPADASARVKQLKPGEWVTITSRHRPSADAEAVVSVNPYVQTPAASATSTS